MVLPVGETTLENSIGVLYGDASHLEDPARADPQCRELENGDFACSLTTFETELGNSVGAPTRADYTVEVSSTGCWAARHSTGGGASHGCINLTDYFGY